MDSHGPTMSFEEFKAELEGGLYRWISKGDRRPEDWFYNVSEYASQEYGRRRRKRLEEQEPSRCAYCGITFTEGQIPTQISPPHEEGKPDSLLFHSPNWSTCLATAGSNAMQRGINELGHPL